MEDAYRAPAMTVVRIDFGPEQAATVAGTPGTTESGAAKRAAWEGSTRRERLPDDWEWRVGETFRVHGDTCHVCKESGADEVDHVIRGDDHRLENLRPIHSWRTPQRCHVFKTAREAAEARRLRRQHRPQMKHPGLI